MTSRSLTTLSLILTLFLLSIPPVGYSQVGATAATRSASQYEKSLAEIESKVEARRKELGIPGMSLAIIKDDNVIFIKGLGYKDFEKKVSVTPDTQFAIGSATKAFTALSVLISQDEGKLSLDDSPKKLLPYFKMYDPETDQKITIRDLLCHSSGLNRTDLAMITGKLTRAELIQVVAQAKPTAKLREKFQYQNLMYTAAGEAVAQAQRMPWESFVPQRIFKPLGMANSTMLIKQMQKAKDYSFGYDYNFDTKETTRRPFREIGEVAPAGSINSSARDMAEWIRFVLNGGMINGKRLVSEKGFDEWLKPQMKMNPTGTVNYGLGWFLQTWNGLKVVQHGGNIDGFNSLVAMIPEKKLGFVMLTNVSSSSLGSDIMPVIWSNILGEPKNDPTNVPATPKPEANSPVEAKELIGKYSPPGSTSAIVEIKEDDGKITFNIPGQQPYALSPKADGSFALAPLPETYFLNPKRDAAGKLTSVAVTQPEGVFEFKLAAADSKPTIIVEDLHAKALDAVGGEANWRKITTRVTESDIDLVHQGVQAKTITWAKAPNLSATETTMTALGKTIASGWEFFDGASGIDAYTFSPAEKYKGKRLDDAKINNDFYGILDWSTNYKKVEVVGLSKVGGEDAYIVTFEPNAGTSYRQFYSTTTFLLLKHEGVVPSSTSSQQLPYSVSYSDYREVDGIKLPFKTVNSTLSNGDIVAVVKSVKHNVPIDDKMFAPRKLR